MYTSVGSAHRKTGIPHFENKWRVEETIRGLGFPSRVIIRPVFFMENLTSPWFLNGDKLCTAMDPKTVLQMIAVDDIGKYGARAFTDGSALNGREIDLAGDAQNKSIEFHGCPPLLKRLPALTPLRRPFLGCFLDLFLHLFKPAA